eukprot:COSAG02_NODE_301_length_25237_cov_19.918490_2_plen_73_part_00
MGPNALDREIGAVYGPTRKWRLIQPAVLRVSALLRTAKRGSPGGFVASRRPLRPPSLAFCGKPPVLMERYSI